MIHFVSVALAEDRTMIRWLLIVVLAGVFAVVPVVADTTWVNMGTVSGTWTISGSPYMIYQGDVSVVSTGTLIIEAGVKVEFTGNYKFHINGLLKSLGIEGDPVTFTADTSSNPDGWGGLRFSDCNDSTLMECCIVEYGNASGMVPDNYGGGVFVNSASPAFANCIIRHNLAEAGGGVASNNGAAPTFYGCEISENSAQDGGGILFMDGDGYFEQTDIVGNTSENKGGGVHAHTSDPEFVGCTFQGNAAREGGGINCYSSDPTFTGCRFLENISSSNGGAFKCSNGSAAVLDSCSLIGNIALGNAAQGGALFLLNQCDVELTNCGIHANMADFGGAIYARNCEPVLEHCVFISNSARTNGGALYFNMAETILRRCTLFRNYADSVGGQMYLDDYSGNLNSCIIANSVIGGGLYFKNSTYCNVRYNDIYGNSGGDIAYYEGNPGHGPYGLCNLNHTNANGDPSDEFMNIMLDPMFVSPATGDVHLQASSPCIDAGNPNLPQDPDGTVADQGAYYFDQLPVENIPRATLPDGYRLLPCYPNPFNSVTVIPFQIRASGQVTLSVFNLLGQKVETLVSQPMSPGSYSVTWDAGSAPSGTYIVRLEAGGLAAARKIILLK
jgi:hypothetical protein